MSYSKRIKYFKQIAVILTFFWTILTFLFWVYQSHNEKKHIEKSFLTKVEKSAEITVSLIEWTNNKNLFTVSEHENQVMRNQKSLRSLLQSLALNDNIAFDLEVNGSSGKILTAVAESTIRTVKSTHQDAYTFYSEGDKDIIFYAKPLLASENCISCHAHSFLKKGDVIGFATFQTTIPSFEEVNPTSYYMHMSMYLGAWILGLFAIWWIHAKGRNHLDEKIKLYEESMYELIDVMEKRDSYTAGHSQRVAEYSRRIVLAMDYTEDDGEFIYKAGMLHDIGKIEIPDSILLKPDTLNEMEYALIKRHSRASYELLSREPFTPLARIALHHHERYDGTGYPDGLKGEFIPFFAQIISVADAFDAMTTNRAYRKSLSKEAALAILESEKGKQFNPFVVDTAKKIFAELVLPENTTQIPKDLLEEMRFSCYFRDQLTGFYNINYLKFIFTHASDCSTKMLCVDHLNCTQFSVYNKQHGWKNGDHFLQRIANEIHIIYPEAMIVRAYSDNFLVLHTTPHEHMDYARIDALLEEHGLRMNYQHIDLDLQEPITFEILEDKLLNFKK